MGLQLTLALGIRDDVTFTNFFTGDNANLVECLKQFLISNGERFIYLWGQPGVGRSHLLQACCHTMNDDHQTAVYLPLKDHKQLTPAIFQDLEYIHLICIDDVDAVLGDHSWEEALFHLYNRAREQHTRLLVAGNGAPQRLTCHLVDLQSRLAWGLVFQVHALTDEQMLLALQMRAHNRGIYLSQKVGQYLLRHCPRNMTTLIDRLHQLDEASLVAKRRLTVPFVKRVLEI